MIRRARRRGGILFVHPPRRSRSSSPLQSLKLECLLLGYDNPYTDCHKFIEGWKELEKRVVDVAKERTADWFKKSVPENQIDAYWTSRIRPASDPSNYSPTLVLTVPLDKDGKPDVEVFGENEQPSTWAEFEASIRDGEFCCIVRVPSLYFMPVRAMPRALPSPSPR